VERTHQQQPYTKPMTQEKLRRSSCWSTAAWAEALETGGERRLEGDPPPPRDRTSPASGQRGTRGRQRGQGRRPAQGEQPQGTPGNRGRPAHSRPRLSRSDDARAQPVRGQPRLDPRGLPGLILPAGPMDAMQRLALMMAVMILGAVTRKRAWGHQGPHHCRTWRSVLWSCLERRTMIV
jgi:hypothetical protein